MKNKTLEKLETLTTYINLKNTNIDDKESFYDFCFISYIEKCFIDEVQFFSIMNKSKSNIHGLNNTDINIKKYYDKYLELFDMFKYLDGMGYLAKKEI